MDSRGTRLEIRLDNETRQDLRYLYVRGSIFFFVSVGSGVDLERGGIGQKEFGLGNESSAMGNFSLHYLLEP